MADPVQDPQLALGKVEAAAEETQPDSFGLSGPHAVGKYATGLREYFRGRPRLALIGEVTGLSVRAKAAYFELRDASRGDPCRCGARLGAPGAPRGRPQRGSEVVIGGGPEYYPGSATASPNFGFRATRCGSPARATCSPSSPRCASASRRRGCSRPQRALEVPRLPRTIGVVTGRDSAALADIRAGLARRGWAGRVVLAHPPVQDRHAAPTDRPGPSGPRGDPEVEMIVVSRGGGSLADLWAFCDETLCRTVALLRVPVIARWAMSRTGR